MAWQAVVATASAVLVGASLSGGPLAAADALPETAEQIPQVAPRPVVPNLSEPLQELATSALNQRALEALRDREPVELPVHRLPDGGLTGAPGQATLDDLPRMAAPNSDGGRGPRRAGLSATGFTAITTGSNIAAGVGELEPPDQGLAVNNGIIAVISNNTAAAFDASGNRLTAPVANSALFQIDPGDRLSNPHVLFDAGSQRWLVTELIWNPTRGFYGFALAVSQTSNLFGRYYQYKIRAFSGDLPACANDSCLPDYPQIGFDANAVFITADLFALGGYGPFVASAIYVLPKSLLASGAAVTSIRFTTDDFVVQPSVPAAGEPFVSSNGGTEYLMSARDILDASTNLRIGAVYNTSQIVSAPQNLRARHVDVAAEPYHRTVPASQPNVVGPYCRSLGVDSSPRLDAGYNSFAANIVLAGGKLYGALASGAFDARHLPRNVVAWFIVEPALSATALTASIYRQGYLVPPDGYSLAYPEFALNHAGSGILALSVTGIDAGAIGGYPSAAIIGFDAFDFAGQPLVPGRGAAPYDGFTGCRMPGPGGVGRWGNYGVGTVDWATGFFYAANEYIPDPATYPRGVATNWGTFITQAR